MEFAAADRPVVACRDLSVAAAFANPEIYEFLETGGMGCALIKAKQRVSALRGGQPYYLAAKWGRLQFNFVVARLDETENHAQQIGNPGNVG